MAGSGGNRILEWFNVIVKVVARVDLLFAVFEVWVLAIELRATAREVLGHRRNRGLAKLLALEATDVGGANGTGDLGVFTEGHAGTTPTRFGGQVNLWVKRCMDADRAIFLTSDVAKLLD